MKKELRSTIMKKRRSMSTSEVMKKSNRIKERLFGMEEFKNAHRILFYVSYDNEVSTHQMIQECLAHGKNIVVPKTNTQDGTLTLSKLTRWDDLENGAYRILEPKKECIVEVPGELLDLIIIPGVVFDEKGNRIGHGMGCYDRLLQHLSKAPSIGLAFEFQIVDRIPAETHDVKVQKIVTEERVITCS